MASLAAKVIKNALGLNVVDHENRRTLEIITRIVKNFVENDLKHIKVLAVIIVLEKVGLSKVTFDVKVTKEMQRVCESLRY